MRQTTITTTMNRIAESYVRLVLAVGQHDPDYVDAYYGPDAWKSETVTQPWSLDQIRTHALATAGELRVLSPARMDEMSRLRHHYLMKQLQSLIARADQLGGKNMTFDEESRVLYDAVAPTYPESHFQDILRDLGTLLPGSGSIPARYNEYKSDFIIAGERLDRVFTAAVEESRKRTKLHIPLPDNESFSIEYVGGKSWSGYNWYKGNSHSLIQVNTDLPISIDRAVDLASHEGYPGHHVYNALLEKHLVREKKWMEFSVYALFSPQSLIAEGTANYGITMAFPEQERLAFEKNVLFPLAGLESSRVELYYNIHALFLKLNYAGNEAARAYLNGNIDRAAAARWLRDYALMSPERAEQRTRFFDQYRSYVINYNLGQDLVQRYIESRTKKSDTPEARWAEFATLLASPRLPSGLIVT
jgi:hypothetical protein